ncbi:glycosylphosphatidylinositol-anchored merozoite surface protein [Babesia divergens]|uniref:Glycosylphosphatidylinositol-anchored merozoite surface protein n=1 Tax=Babesia divergens TaxID=32595 RepID=A0AAD9GKN2_BABDI|nr:glycosylphosphatidylinositol-anchored merozoite surface protein [Babesia divergens]
MKFLGILRASALFIFLSAFHGPGGVFCSNLEIDLSNESFTVEVSDVSENLEDSTVESPLVENPSQEPSTLNLSDGSKSLDEVLKELKEKRKAEHEELLKKIAEQRTELVERLSKSDAPFSLEDMTLFLGILRDEADVDPEVVQKVGEKIHTFLGNLGIHGADARSSLENLMKKIQEYVLNSSSSSSEPSPDDASTQEIKAILEQLPDSNVNSLSGDFYAPKKPFNVEVPDIYEDPEMLSMECRISDPDGACVYVPSNLSYLPEYQKKAETKDDESKSKDRRKGFFGKLFGWLYCGSAKS